MQLKRLATQYFLHFGEWSEIEFNDEKIVSIIGKWDDEPRRSNRSGKSSFVEIISYVLYGKTRAKKEIDLINRNYPMEDMICELEFNDGVIIRRGRTHDNQIILELTGFEGADKRVVQEQINTYIGLTYEDFIMTSYFLQGDIHTFMEAGSTSQQQIITRWLEKSYWKNFERSAKDRYLELEQKEIVGLEYIVKRKPNLSLDQEIKDNINTLESKKELLETALATHKLTLEAINDQISIADEVQQLHETLETYQNDIMEIKDEINEYIDEIRDIDHLIERAIQNEERLLKLPDLRLEYDTKSLSYNLQKEQHQKLNEQLIKSKAELTMMRSRIKEMKQFNNICPVMQRQCIAISSVQDVFNDLISEGQEKAKLIEELKNQYEELADQLDDTNSELLSVRVRLQGLIQLQKEPLQSELNKKKDIILSRMARKNEKLKEIEIEYKKVKSQYNKVKQIDVNKLRVEQKKLISFIDDNQSSLDDIIKLITQENVKLQHNKELRLEAIKAEKKIQELNQEISEWKYVAYMFSKKGIPANQVEAAFQEIEDEANIILEKVNSDLTIEFSPDKEMKTWEENCVVCDFLFPKGFRQSECPNCGNERTRKRKEQLSIIIKSHDKEMDFNLESGGGKVLISLAIRLAFVRMLQRRIGAHLKLLVFDEIFGQLDEVNRSIVFKLLTDTLINDFGFQQIFAISHEEQIRDVIPDVITITKYDNYSSFSWE